MGYMSSLYYNFLFCIKHIHAFGDVFLFDWKKPDAINCISKKGSIALASITAIKRNKESKNWFEKKELEFKLAA